MPKIVPRYPLPSTHSKGFTLVEILVVITIIAILSTIVASVNANFQKNARDVQRKRDMRNIGISMRIYYDNKGHYPVQNIIGILNGFIFGCENDQPDISLWTKIYPGEPWTCTDDQYPFTYMKVYPKDPIPWKPPAWGKPNFLNYVYIPSLNAESPSGFCTGSLTCQGYRVYACLENIKDPDASGPPGGVLEDVITCPPDRVPILMTNLDN